MGRVYHIKRRRVSGNCVEYSGKSSTPFDSMSVCRIESRLWSSSLAPLSSTTMNNVGSNSDLYTVPIIKYSRSEIIVDKTFTLLSLSNSLNRLRCVGQLTTSLRVWSEKTGFYGSRQK